MIDKYELDILSHPILGREGVLLVKPEHQTAFIQDVETEGIAYRIHSDDVKRYQIFQFTLTDFFVTSVND